MASTIGNAKNKCVFYRVEYAADELTVVQGLSGSTEATSETHKAIALQLMEDANIQPQDDGTIKVTLKQFQDDKALNDFLNAVAKLTPSTASRPERKTQDGQTYGGVATGNYVLCIYYGGEDETDGVKVLAAFGNIARTSGSRTDKYNEWQDPTVEFVGALTPVDLDIAATLFDPTIIDATDVSTKIATIDKGACWIQEFVDVPA